MIPAVFQPNGGYSDIKGIFKNWGGAGFWYDANDLKTMFQDTAGTIAVTTSEQTIALWKDKSGNGVHLQQTTAAYRPVLRNRYNLIQYSEAFTGGGTLWTLTSVNVSQNHNQSDPLKGTSASIVTALAATSVHRMNLPSTGFLPNAGTPYIVSFYAKTSGATLSYLYFSTANIETAGEVPFFDTTTGNTWPGPTQNTVTFAGMQNVGNGWYRCFIRWTPSTASTTNDTIRIGIANSTATHGTQGTYFGSTARAFYLYGVQITQIH